jgi:hypothetical protein
MRYRHQVVEINQLRGNPWNPNVLDAEAEQKLDASLKRLGVFKPIITRETKAGLEIIGGHHRWESAKRIGVDEVPIINLGDVDDTRAKEIGLADTGRWGHDDAGLLADVLNDLQTDELADFLPFSQKDFDAIFTASEVNLDDLNLDDEDEDLLGDTETKAPPSHTIMRFKVPVLDAEILSAKLKQVMKDQDFSSSDSLTNAGDALVYLLGEKDDLTE